MTKKAKVIQFPSKITDKKKAVREALLKRLS